MNGFIELLERKINGCDALGGLEREKAVYQSVLKDYKKQLNIGGVMCSLRDEAIKYAKEKYGKKYNLAEYHIQVMNCIKDYEKGLQISTKLKLSSNNT